MGQLLKKFIFTNDKILASQQPRFYHDFKTTFFNNLTGSKGSMYVITSSIFSNSIIVAPVPGDSYVLLVS